MGFLIFGASGFIGSRILDWLEEKDEIITIGTNSPKIQKYKNIRNYLNLNDDELVKLVKNFHTIIDASGIGINKEEYLLKNYLQKNSIWPGRLAKACIQNNKRLIWLSTIHCEKYEKSKSNNFDKYSLSKYLGEQIIKTIPKWQENILIIRLGNMIGSPGKLYRGTSDLFAMDIAFNLVKNNKATIRSNLDKEINLTSLIDFLNCINQKKYGQKKFCSSYKFKLTDIANCIKSNYENITNNSSNIFFKGQILNCKKELNFPDNIVLDIRELINFYVERN